jgi:hypothetical protein
MRFRALLIVAILFSCNAQAGEAPCDRGTPKKEYAGPLFDAMAQIESGLSSTVLAGMDESGVARMALFARKHHKRDGESDVLSLKKRFPDRFVIGVPKQFDLRDDLTDRFVGAAVEDIDKGVYQFVGEILLAHADKSHGEQTASGERYISADGRNVARLLAAMEERHIPVMTHWEVYDWQRDWPKFDALYTHFPGVTFIWPHAGFSSAEQVKTVLSTHPNVVITLSKKETDQRSLSSEEKAELLGDAIVDACGRLLPEWRGLLEKYHDRFMFATDAHKDFRWNKYDQIVRKWRLILGQLPDPLARELAWVNAERIYNIRH